MDHEITESVSRHPRSKTKEEFRIDALAMAKKMLLEKGVEKLNMSEISQALGVSKPRMYQEFESKQALIEGVFKAALGDQGMFWITLVQRASATFGEFLDQAGNEFMRIVDSPMRFESYQLVMRESVYSREVASSFAKHIVDPMGASLRLFISEAIERGECRRMDALVVQKLIVAPLYFVILNQSVSGSQGLPPDVAKQYLAASCASLKNYLCIGASKASADTSHGEILLTP